jgi:hypothetical protein
MRETMTRAQRQQASRRLIVTARLDIFFESSSRTVFSIAAAHTA